MKAINPNPAIITKGGEPMVKKLCCGLVGNGYKPVRAAGEPGTISPASGCCERVEIKDSYKWVLSEEFKKRSLEKACAVSVHSV
jgi:hypothetical protein